ncbi:hypothetical protein AV530_012813 [Patagioenas fasciata monilis]|uniref:Uncharacterized protein n=1 Tax=Patagioenas fasciata monilis TaxID=372326 RepID=A0A1V4J9F1_PATFA|nr:hypothetical protein AV530_012813 [Patagioenas fasciata monilis]
MIATSNSLNKARVSPSCIHAFSLPANRLKNRVSTKNPLELTRARSKHCPIWHKNLQFAVGNQIFFFPGADILQSSSTKWPTRELSLLSKLARYIYEPASVNKEGKLHLSSST